MQLTLVYRGFSTTGIELLSQSIQTRTTNGINIFILGLHNILLIFIRGSRNPWGARVIVRSLTLVRSCMGLFPFTVSMFLPSRFLTPTLLLFLGLLLPLLQLFSRLLLPLAVPMREVSFIFIFYFFYLTYSVPPEIRPPNNT